MTVHRLATGQVSAVLVLPEELDITAAQTADRTLPGGWTLKPALATLAADVKVTIGTAAVGADADTVHLRLPRSVAASDTLAYATYTALERARQQQHMATVHATAMHTPEGQATLLLGVKGAGKTSTALALAARGWVHAGDDLVLLGERGDSTVSVWPGKPTAAIRDPARPLAPKTQCALRPFAAGSAPLAWVVRLAVQPAVPAATLRAGTPLSVNEKLRLHELLARYISGLPTPVSGLGSVPYGPVWPLDTPALARWRSRLIARLAACRFDYLCAPGPEAAADLLTKEADAG